MLTIYSDDHQLHHSMSELSDGQLGPSVECPKRADNVLESMRQASLGEIIGPDIFGLDPVLRVHDARFVEFLQEAWDLWSAEGHDFDAVPISSAVRGMRQIEPDTIDGKLSYFSFDADSAITSGTWRATSSAVNVALTGAARLQAGERCVFSLCRPPGHHASFDFFGGYCYLNNAAIAAQHLRDQGARKVAILDVDYHHGNGTQSIFYKRDDVLFVSIHGDPAQEYPFFLGRSDETGEGAGKGFNANYPLRWQSTAKAWFDALGKGCALIADYAPDFVIISLGLDTYIEDPISQFRLTTNDYLQLGSRIAKLGVPMLFVLEGGYAVDAIGTNAANVLTAAVKGMQNE